MNRNNYDSVTISFFDIIGSYLVDVYYNLLYTTAKEKSKSSNTSLTEEYKASAVAFMKGVKNNKGYYIKTFKGMHKFFQTCTKHSTISLIDFEDQLLSHFLPIEHHKIMNNSERDYFTNRIITNIVTDFGVAMCQIENLKMVIDDHHNDVNVVQLRNLIIEIQITEKNNIYTHFVKDSMQKSELVSVDIVNRMKSTIKELIRDKTSFQVRADRAESVLNKLNNAFLQSKEDASRLESMLASCQEELRQARLKIYELENNRLSNTSFRGLTFVGDKIPTTPPTPTSTPSSSYQQPRTETPASSYQLPTYSEQRPTRQAPGIMNIGIPAYRPEQNTDQQNGKSRDQARSSYDKKVSEESGSETDVSGSGSESEGSGSETDNDLSVEEIRKRNLQKIMERRGEKKQDQDNVRGRIEDFMDDY